jgi:iron complex outermembrane receptor protein
VGAQTVFYNAGGVVYKGLEAEGTVYVGDGFSVFANGSLNSAKDKTDHQWVAYAPNSTAAGGIIYNRHGWYGSLIAKHIGKQYGDTGQTIPIGAYTLANAALSYTLKGDDAPAWLQQATVNLQVHNVFDKKTITNFFGYASDAASTPLYWTSPQRSYFVTVSAHL